MHAMGDIYKISLIMVIESGGAHAHMMVAFPRRSVTSFSKLCELMILSKL